MARRPNAVCKVSGIVASTRGRPWRPDDLAPFINHVLEEFGPDRVVFGGDWPVCTLGASLAGWVKALRDVVASGPRPTSGNSSTTTRFEFIDWAEPLTPGETQA